MDLSLGVKVLIMFMIKGNFTHSEEMIEKVLGFFFRHSLKETFAYQFCKGAIE